MGKVKILMNNSKEVNIITAPARITAQTLRRSTTMGPVADYGRYLGAQHSGGPFFNIERECRLEAARKAWYVLYSFWISTIALRFKMVVFMCIIIGIMISGLEAVAGARAPLSREDLAPLETKLDMYLRRMFMGEATIKMQLTDAEDNITVVHRALSHEALLRKARRVPICLELRMRRLKLLQEFFARPRHHRVILAALLGHIPARPDAIDLEGGVIAARVHP